MNTTHHNAVEISQVTKTFPGSDGSTVTAVGGIDLTIRSGEIVAFLGPNGAGKTTTLDMVLGLTTPSSGTITTYGAGPRKAVSAGRVSAVLQTGGLLRDITVRETANLIASTYRSHTPVDEVLERTGLTGIAGRMVSKCSGGEQQRLRFALALLPDPDLLILDEPTAGMDVNARHDFWDTMRADSNAGRTVIFATHYLEEADAFADRIVLIAKGRIIADGSTEQIRAMASGRTVTATIDPATRDRVLDALRALPVVQRAELRGDRVSVHATDSDLVALALLTDLGGHDLEITTAGLEEAFIALTADSPGSPAATVEGATR